MNYATDRLDRRARVADSLEQSSSSPPRLWIDFQEGLRHNDHERIACSLKDAGWNSHAIFHYAQAWMLEPDNAQAAADYCQMVELAGYPVTALIGVFVFRSRGVKLRTPAERTVEDVSIEVANNPLWLLQGGERQHRHCGCGHPDCGISECFFVVADHPLTTILDAVREYTATMQLRYQQDVISAHNILGAMTKVKRSGRSRDAALCVNVDPPLPGLFVFWDDGSKQSNLRTLPVPFQLLALKLFYLVIPSVAIEAVVRMTIDDASLPHSYKSHRAFYVFILSLTLGERIKPGRRQHLKYYHEPLWDRLWNSKRPPSGSADDHFLHQFDQLLRALSKGSGKEHTLPPTWLQPPFVATKATPLYFLGDSHVLSLAWQTLTLPNSIRNLIVVPAIVTGLKAWHVQKTTRFFTQTCLQGWLKRLPESAPILVSAGEIDCREGVGGPLLQGYATTCHAQVQATVRAYIAALDSYGRTLAVLPVAPHVHRKGGRLAGQVARRSAMRVWNTEIRTLLSSRQGEEVGRLVLLDYSDQLVLTSTLNENGYTLNPLFNADGTHMNAAFAPLLVDALMNCAERNIRFRQQLGL